MEVIIIFTDWDTIKNYQNTYELSWVPQNEQVKKLSINKDKLFLIVYDQNNDVDGVLKNINNNSNVYILHHSLPKDVYLKSLQTKLQNRGCNVHLTKRSHYNDEYKFIQEIDKYGVIEETKNNTSLEKTFDQLKEMLSGCTKMDIVLEFLHKCLLNKATDYDKNKLSEDLSLSTEEKAIINNSKNDLSEIRDMLLGKIFN